jgi:hypothetical protein
LAHHRDAHGERSAGRDVPAGATEGGVTAKRHKKDCPWLALDGHAYCQCGALGSVAEQRAARNKALARRPGRRWRIQAVTQEGVIKLENDPIIFLDFDGVLNSHAWFAARRDSTQLDPAAVALLNQLIERTDAQVVVSSSWRIGFSRLELEAGLRQVGFAGTVLDVTPNLREAYARGKEIALWRMQNRHVGPFVILDDDSDMGELMPFLIKTGFDLGLQQEHIDRAVAILTEAA